MTKTGTAGGLDIAGVVVKLNSTAPPLLNAVFGVPDQSFKAGDVVGTGKVEHHLQVTGAIGARSASNSSRGG